MGIHPAAFPRVDDHLVRPETREEMVRGRLVIAAPASPPHAKRQARVAYVTGSAVAHGYANATEMLTRASIDSDFATDACILREGVDPATGGRYLEELAFEVVATQSLRRITERAQLLTARGVRRIIAILVKKDEVREWSPEQSDWIVLDPEGVIDDPTLAAPIPVRALLDAAEADRAVVQALYAKQEPAMMTLVEAKGLVQGIEALCTALGIPLDAERRTTLEQLDVAGLRALLQMLANERRWP